MTVQGEETVSWLLPRKMCSQSSSSPAPPPHSLSVRIPLTQANSRDGEDIEAELI